MHAEKDLLKLVETSYFKERYLFSRYLGRGGFGVVFEGCLQSNPMKPIAVKVIQCSEKWATSDKYVKNEINIHSKVTHPNIVEFFGFRKTPQCAFIEMELMSGGHLNSFIAHRKLTGKKITEEDGRVIIRQVMQALVYLHKNLIAHRDVKPENILLDSLEEPTKIKLSDFGLGVKQVPCLYEGFKLDCGTEIYKAPEQMQKSVYSKSVDIWALGIVTYMLLHEGKHPFLDRKGRVDRDFSCRVAEGPLVFHRAGLSDLAKDFISRLLVKDQFERYLADEAFKHPWLTGNLEAEIPLKFVHRMLIMDTKQAMKDCFKSLVLMHKLRSHAVEEKARRDSDLAEARRKSEEMLVASVMDLEPCSELFLTDKGRPTDRLIPTTPVNQANTEPKKIRIIGKGEHGYQKRPRLDNFQLQPKLLSSLRPNAAVSVAARKSELMSSQIISNIQSILKKMEGRADATGIGLMDKFNSVAVRMPANVSFLGSNRSGADENVFILKDLVDQIKAENGKDRSLVFQGKPGILKRARNTQRNSSVSIFNKENFDDMLTKPRKKQTDAENLSTTFKQYTDLTHGHSKERMLRRAESTVLGEINSNCNVIDRIHTHSTNTLAFMNKPDATRRQAKFLIRSNTHSLQPERRFADL